MAISEADLSVVEGALAAGAGSPAVAALRQSLPHLSLTRCDASDVTESPFRSFPDYELHLVDAADHCVTLTQDPARATGIVLARKGA